MDANTARHAVAELERIQADAKALLERSKKVMRTLGEDAADRASEGWIGNLSFAIDGIQREVASIRRSNPD